MKTRLTLLFACGILFGQAQFIDQLSISPANPTSNDALYFIANCYFGSGSCDQKTLFLNINGFEISASAMHCLGLASYICNASDSFYLGPLPAGNYQLRFRLDVGIGTIPCSPGIVAGPTDSIYFTVQSTTGLQEIGIGVLQISTNPTSSETIIKLSGNDFIGHFEIWNLSGVLVKQWKSDSKEILADFSDLPFGIYRLIFTSKNASKTAINFLRTD